MSGPLPRDCPDCGEHMLHEQNRAGMLCRKCAKFWGYLELIAAVSENASKAGSVSLADDKAGAVSNG
jgi:DNA-directed RNA polymerase subunit M/transcription elongation factor TFIIS